MMITLNHIIQKNANIEKIKQNRKRLLGQNQSCWKNEKYLDLQFKYLKSSNLSDINEFFFLKKYNENNEITRYKVRTVAQGQGFSQRPNIDYEEMYSPIMDKNKISGRLSNPHFIFPLC